MLACALSISQAHAGDIHIEPVSISLPPGTSATTISIINRETTVFRAAVRVFSWDQRDGEEVLTPTKDLVASPGLITIAPGSYQRIRVVLLTPPADTDEHSYRIVLDEDPDHPETIVTRYSLPAFVNDAGTADGAWSTELTPIDAYSSRLRVANPGRHRLKLMNLAYRSADGRLQPLTSDLAGYVLAGRYKHWTLRLPVEQLRGGRLEATVNGQPAQLWPLTQAPASGQ